MTPPSCWPDSNVPIVTDASAIINLNASGRASEILKALAGRFLVTDEVINELAHGVENGRSDTASLEKLLGAGLVRRTSLGSVGREAYELMVIGSAEETLDDGEAATIAMAAELNGLPVIDDSKGRRICGLRHPALKMLGSIEMFAHPSVEAALGRESLSEIVFLTLSRARMHVLPHYYPWLKTLLDREKLVLCKSLPKSMRR